MKGDLGQYRDYKVVDLKGWTILPGLIDNHVHITSPFMRGDNVLSLMDQQIEYNFRNCVMSGVTTVRDVGGFPGKINKFKSKVDDNEIPRSQGDQFIIHDSSKKRRPAGVACV